jgi:glycerophosphoryl diester phosphodiesterase
MTPRKLIALAAAALALAAPAAATAKTPFAGIHAHRGGTIFNGTATLPENSLDAFSQTFKNIRPDVLELDAKLTADNVPVIMHDATLDRTTNCTGQVHQRTAADLEANCRIDTIGTEDKLAPSSQPVAIPTLAEVLAFAKSTDAKLHLEIKNQPTDPDYDDTPAFAQTVLGAVEASGIDKKTVLIQSFWPPNLDQAKARGFSTTLLLLQQGANQQGIDLAKEKGYTVVSPGWPTAIDPKDFIDASHAAGKPVIPYTIDDAKQIKRALDLGADGVITNDPALGTTVRDAKRCTDAVAVEKQLKRAYKKKLAAYRKSPTKARKKAAAKARGKYSRASRARKRTCTAAER